LSIIGGKQRRCKVTKMQTCEFFLAQHFSVSPEQNETENQQLDRAWSEKNFSARHFHGVSSHADVDDLVTLHRG
jgi:hypothetical protein